MAKIVRTETRKRGVVGQVFKWLFILFNLFMAYSLFQGCSATLPNLNQGNEYEQAGAAIGTGLGIGFILFIWLAGVVILGAAAFFTRGKLVITEETRED